MGKRTIEVNLTDESERFVEWLSKRDRVTLQEELQTLFYIELREHENMYQKIYMEEMRKEHDETEGKKNGAGTDSIRTGGSFGCES